MGLGDDTLISPQRSIRDSTMASPRDALVPTPSDGLRAWGLAHPVVAWLLAVLAPRGPAPGLYVERAEGWDARGVALVRVVSVTRDGASVIAEARASERRGARGPERSLRLVAEGGAEPESPDAWWLATLARHYARGGPVVDLDDAVPCAR